MLGLVLFWNFAGCATVEDKFDKFVDLLPEKLIPWSEPAPAKSNDYYHKVRYHGETLSTIAEWYTGDRDNWRDLAKANPELSPNHIGIGTTIRVPEKLLRTHRQMPKDFVEAVAKRQEAKRARLAKAPAKPYRPKRSIHIHEVRYFGETLAIIAKWYTGDAKNWRALTKANRQLDPNRITIGAKVRIPSKLLNTRKPMPRDFVVYSRKAREPKPPPAALSQAEMPEKAARPSAPSPSTKIETEELELFGPK